ncbi:unnamed protein product, partial [Laminaria digitata]
TGGGETVSEDLMTKVFLWSLTSYSRVVYLDPRSRVQKNPDALFACEGFCAASAVPSTSSRPSFETSAEGTDVAAAAAAAAALSTDDDEDEAGVVLDAPLSFRPSWQPSTSVMVLEPSAEVHAAMLTELARRAGARSLEAQVFLSSFLGAAGDRCTPFEDLVESAGGVRGGGGGGGDDVLGGDGGGGWVDEGDAVGASSDGSVVDGGSGSGSGSGVGGGGGGRGGGGGGRGGGGFLEDALMPVVLLNGPHMPRCAVGRERTPAGVCQRLPPTFAAPLTDYHERGDWGRAQKRCALCEQPHIIHFADEDSSWKRAAYDHHKALFWKWGKDRQQRNYPYGNFFAPWVLFFIPCVVLAFARVYYKIAGAGDGQGGSRGGAGVPPACPESSPSKAGGLIPWFLTPKKQQQQQQRQMAILPSCGIAAAYDGGNSSVGASLEAASYRGGSPSGAAVGPEQLASGGGGLGGGAGGGGGRLQTGACYALSALVWALGLAWFRATRTLALEVVDERWPPAIAAAVYNAWLCCALVLGLYVMDYLYYALLTRGRTLAKDTAAVAVFALGVALLRSTDGGGGGGGEGGVAWEGAVGVGIIALGVGHGSRAGAAHHLSGRGHFRCITASCVAGALVSLAMCYYDDARTMTMSQEVGSSGAGGGGAAAAVATVALTAQMCFTALVYASVIGGARLRADMDEAGSKIGRSCSTASFAAEMAAVAAATAATSGASPDGRVSSGAGGGGGGGAMEARPQGGGWGVVLSGVARGAVRVKDAVWRGRWVTACVAVLVLWKVSSSLRPTSPGRRFEKYGLSCLGNDAGEFVEAGVKRMSRVCGAEQALRPVVTGAYFEAFRQDKVCLEVAGGGFLTLDRIHVFQACAPENQFVFQAVPSKKARVGNKEALSSGGAAADEYCVYNPTSGFYLSAQARPKAQCGEKERWRVNPVPLSARPKKGTGFSSTAATTTPGLVTTAQQQQQQQQRQSTASVLVHPSFLSRGPLHTFYGYLLAATVLLVARAVFAKLAGWQSAAASSRGGGGASGSGGVSAGDGCSGGASSKHRHGGIGARQRSRGRHHSRSHNNVADTGYFGDPGYAGDAETGGVGTRDLSESPVPGAAQQLDRMGWNTDIMFAVSADKGEDLAADTTRAGSSTVATAWPKGFGGAHLSRDKDAAPVAAASVRAARGHERLGKLFSWLCMACDATLLAGLWCLIPAHFAQAMSALTRDHHSAIDRGLGMDPNNPGNGPWSRSLGDGVVGGGNGVGGGGGETLSVLGLTGVGGGDVAAQGGGGGAPSLACDGGAWWLTSALVRLHLVFLLVAFCHLHGAVKAAAASSTVRGRNRRTGKKTTERASLWGLRSGERLALRLRTALGVLTLLCAAVTAAGAEFGERSGLLFLGLHAHPAWGKCAASAGLDESWGPVSPLLVFAMLSAAAGVYVRAGATSGVRRESSGSAASVEDECGGGGGGVGSGGVCQHRGGGCGGGGGGGVSSGGITATAGARHRSNDARRLTFGRALAR